MRRTAHETAFQFPSRRLIVRTARGQKQPDALLSELQAARAREQALLREKRDLSQRQITLGPGI